MPKIILASASPRRRELLKLIYPDFDVVTAEVDESTSIKDPAKMVEELALRKAAAVAAIHPDSIVIGSDTVVSINGEVLGKPADKDDAFAMLKKLSGKTHSVFTGVAAIYGSPRSAVCKTDVTFADMSDEDIRWYIETDEPMDKAGSYGVQGYASRFIDRIDGCYFNVMGLPIRTLYTLLTSSGLLD